MNESDLLQQYREIKRGGLPPLQAWLAAGHPVDQRDPFGYTLLHYAAEDGNLDIARSLLAQGAVVHARTAYGYTPLHYAARRADPAPAATLLAAFADPNAQLTKGRLRWWKPLYFAYSYDSAAVIALLAPHTQMPKSKVIALRQHALRGPYEIVAAYDSWPHPADIEPTPYRCLHCGEQAIYNVGYTADGGGVHADRLELFQCGNCSARFIEQTPLRGALRPWEALKHYDFRSDPHPTNFGH